PGEHGVGDGAGLEVGRGDEGVVQREDLGQQLVAVAALVTAAVDRQAGGEVEGALGAWSAGAAGGGAHRLRTSTGRTVVAVVVAVVLRASMEHDLDAWHDT